MIDSSNIQRVNTSWMYSGTVCWARAAEDEKSICVYRRVTIIGLDKNRQNAHLNYQQSREKGPDMVPVKNVLEANSNYEANPEGWDDMVTMNVLNEAQILNNVWVRLEKDKIYTYIGPTLIAMNPYKSIQGFYQEQVLKLFHHIVMNSAIFNQREAPPHTFAIAASAYLQLFDRMQNQAIVISGESGAGKTENAKYAMSFITSLSQKQMQMDKSKNKIKSEDVPIEEKILRCNPILQAFGNAQTVRNDNSSRFGKYVRIWIDKQNRRILGASISNYLLEKSRVTLLSQGERNYHVFYHFLKGMQSQTLLDSGLIQSQSDKKEKRLEYWKSFNYLNQSTCFDVDTINDEDLFQEVMQSFAQMKFIPQEVEAIFSVLSAILHIGNLKIDGTCYTENNPCGIGPPQTLKYIAKTLLVSEETVKKSIIFKTREVAKQVIESPINQKECLSVRDSFARALYDKMFSWLVLKLNQGILPSDFNEFQGTALSLGLLDIFGFENFNVNSFEQVCINFTNEKLQQLYISYVFKAEEKEFLSEGLQDHITAFQYKDNQDIIDLIDQPPTGVFDTLDDSCQIATGTDDLFLKKLISSNQQNVNFQFSKMASDQFTIIHTAKQVEYTVTGFRMQNKDEIGRELQRCVTDSINPFIVSIWKGEVQEIKDDPIDFNSFRNTMPTSTGIKNNAALQKNAKSIISQGSSKTDQFLGAQFRTQMKELMSELLSCDVHFIRCIKPNEEKQKGLVNGPFVMQQIRYLGVLESIRVRKLGFPIRIEYNHFYTQYHELDPINRRIRLQRHLDMRTDMPGLSKQMIKRVLPDINLKLVLFGNNKIYMKLEAMDNIDRKLQEWWRFQNKKALIIQKQYKVYKFKKSVKEGLKRIHFTVKALTRVQATFKMKHAQKVFKVMKEKKICFEKLTQTFEKMKKNRMSKVISQLYANCLSRQQGEYWQQGISILTSVDNQNKLKHFYEQWRLFAYKKSGQLKEENQIGAKLQVEDEMRKQLQEMQKEKEQEQLALKKEKEISRRVVLDQNIPLDVVTDEFSTKGLIIWPYDKNIKQNINKKNKASIPEDYLNFPEQYQVPSQIEVEKSDSSRQEQMTFQEMDPLFMKRVQQSVFLDFCDRYVVKGKNWGKKAPGISQIMSFQKTNLVEPLTNCKEQYINHSPQVFRSMLKLAGCRNSRFPETFHCDNVISMCFGQPPQISDNFIESDSTKPPTQTQETKIDSNSISTSALPRNYNSIDMMPSDGMMNAQKVMTARVQNLLLSPLLKLRDEAFLQICKQVEGNPSIESVMQLLQFTSLMLNLFAPSQNILYPLLNFYYTQAQNERDMVVQLECKYIFMKLAQIAQAYPIIREADPLNFSPNQIELATIYQNQEIQQQFKKVQEGQVSPFDVFYSHLSVVEPRQLMPSQEEMKYISGRKGRSIQIYMFSQQILWVPIQSFFTVKDTRDAAVQMLGMSQQSQFFSLYEVKKLDGSIIEQRFLNDNHKINDILAKHQLDQNSFQQQYIQKLQHDLYLRIRVYYRLFGNDRDSINMFYMQNVFEVQRCRKPLMKQDAIRLAAVECFSLCGPYDPRNESSIRSIFKELVPSNIYGLMSNEEWWNKILDIYQGLKFPDKTTARWQYLNLLRPFDLFLSYQFESQLFHVMKSAHGYIKNQEPENVVLAVRPLQVVISSLPNRETLQIINFSNMTQWGQSLGSPPYFFVRCENDELYIFAFKNIETADYLINAYVNWKLARPVDLIACPSYNDMLSFVVAPNQQDPF